MSSLSNGAKSYLQDGINKMLALPKFQQLWVSANTFAHTQLISALQGHSAAAHLRRSGAQPRPAAERGFKDVQTRASALLGENITLPAVSGTTIPVASCQKIAAAIGRPLPLTCGQVPLLKLRLCGSHTRGPPGSSAWAWRRAWRHPAAERPVRRQARPRAAPHRDAGRPWSSAPGISRMPRWTSCTRPAPTTTR